MIFAETINYRMNETFRTIIKKFFFKNVVKIFFEMIITIIFFINATEIFETVEIIV